MTKNIEYIIGSPVDHEKFICEIIYKGKMMAELSHERGELMLEIYPSSEGGYWTIPLSEFQGALEHAKKTLIGN